MDEHEHEEMLEEEEMSVEDVPWEYEAPELLCAPCASNFVAGYADGAKHLFTLVGTNVSLPLELSCPPLRGPTRTDPAAWAAYE